MQGMSRRRKRRLSNLAVGVLMGIVVLGGYGLYRLVGHLGTAQLRQETAAQIELEKSLDAAQSALSWQTQEWKNVLLRSYDAEMYARHLRAYQTRAVEVSNDLQRAQQLMESLGLDAAPVRKMIQQEQTLLATYDAGLKLLDPADSLAFRKVDALVHGADRQLQDDLQAFVTAHQSHTWVCRPQMSRVEEEL